MSGIFKTEDYAGLIPVLKDTTINMDLLFNTRDKNADSKLSVFKTSPSVKINKGESAINECGFIPRRCVNFGKFEIEADYAISVNDLFDSCIEQMSEEEAMEHLKNTARIWRENEATYAYSKIVNNMTDTTAETLANVELLNIRDQITYNIKKLASAGYNPNNLIVATGTDGYYDLMDLEIDCCDIGIASQETGTVYKNKLKVNMLTWIRTDILSGHFPEDGALLDEDRVKFMIYNKEYAPYKEFCEHEPVLRNKEFEDDVETRTQVIGKEHIGAAYFDQNSAIVVYDAIEPTPATGAVTAVTSPTNESVQVTYDYIAGTDEIERSKLIIYETANPSILCGEITPLTEGVGIVATFTENILPETDYTIRLIQSGNDLDSSTITTIA